MCTASAPDSTAMYTHDGIVLGIREKPQRRSLECRPKQKRTD